MTVLQLAPTDVVVDDCPLAEVKCPGEYEPDPPDWTPPAGEADSAADSPPAEFRSKGEANYDSHKPNIELVGDGELSFCNRCKGGEAELLDQSCDERMAMQAGNGEPTNETPPASDADSTAKPRLSEQPLEVVQGVVDAAVATIEINCPDVAAEIHFRQRMRSASDRVAETALAKLHADTVAKSRKKDFEAALEALNEIASRGPEHMPLFDQQDNRPAGSQTVPSLPSGTSQDSPPAAVDPDAWRTAPLSDLGLPPKLAERLADAGISTIGELESYRANPGLRAIKGVGAAKVTLIEDAVIAWLSVHRDAAVLAQASSNATAANMSLEQYVEHHRQSDPCNNTPADDAAIMAAGGDPQAYGDADEIIDPERLKEMEQVRQRAAELAAAGELAAGPDPLAWQSGRSAHRRCHRVTDCPYIPSVEQDEWLRGWLSGKAADEESPPAEGEAGNAVETIKKPRKKRAKKGEVAA